MAFATTTDVAIRLGRDLTTAEAAMAEQVIELVTGLIADAAGQAAAWAAALDPVPAYYRALCIDRVLKVGTNPNLVQSMSEQLGAYSKTKTFPRDITGVFLTEQEERLCRQAVFGAAGSFRPRSVVDDLIELRETDAIEGAA